MEARGCDSVTGGLRPLFLCQQKSPREAGEGMKGRGSVSPPSWPVLISPGQV